MTSYGYTSFGLLIGFFLPGFAGLFCLRFWSASVDRWFDAVITPSSGVGPLSVVLLISLVVGLQVSLFRWLIFEKWLCRHDRLEEKYFKTLSDEGHLSAFQVVIEQHYRYHQFWGGIAVVIPVGMLGWMLSGLELNWPSALTLGFLIFVEGLTVVGAIEAFRFYTKRAKAVLVAADDEAREASHA